MAIPLDYYNIFGKAPEGKVLNKPLADANYYFGIQDPFLLSDTNRYFMDAPVPKDTDEGIVTLPIDTNVINQGGGEGEREELGPASPRKRNTGDGLFEKSLSRVNNTGGITNAPIDMENLQGYLGNLDDYDDLNDYNKALGMTLGMTGKQTLRRAPDVFDVDKVGIKDPSIMKIANYNDLFTDERFSLPENIQKRNKGIFSIRDFLPGGKYSLTGMAISGLKGINDRIQSSNLAKSTSLADYRDMMSYGGYEEREAAREKTMKEARDLQKIIDARKTSIPTNQDKGRGQPPGPKTKTAPKSKGYNYANTPGGGRDEGNRDGGGGRNDSGAGDRAGNSGGTGGRRGGGGRYR